MRYLENETIWVKDNSIFVIRGPNSTNIGNKKIYCQCPLKTVFNTTKYLVSNGQPFRGNEENTNFNDQASGGLYLNTFTDLIFAQDPNLEEIAKQLPKNAKY